MRATVIGDDTTVEISDIKNIRVSAKYVDVLVPGDSDDADTLKDMTLNEAVISDEETYAGEIIVWEIGFGDFAFRVRR